MFVNCCGVTKEYDGKPVLNQVDIAISQGQILSLLGPSGTGKSTLLRCIAGFENLTSGKVILANQDITQMPPEQRPVVMMFQQPLLFPHMTVLENITYGLKVRGVDRDEAIKSGYQLLERIEMPDYGKRYPYELSGGQQQRVALARALILKPKLLLLDEPFSSLDADLRTSIRDWVKVVLNEEGITAIFVTHDKEEAMIIGDQLAIMNQQKIEQIGKSLDVYNRPETPFVAEFYCNGIVLNQEAFIPLEKLKILPSKLQAITKGELTWQGKINSRFIKHGQWFDKVTLINHDSKSKKSTPATLELIIKANTNIDVGNLVIVTANTQDIYYFDNDAKVHQLNNKEASNKKASNKGELRC
ncbi:ABC transporter ATP-binding protein [Desulfuribacillus alkaliarsenatis]|uniref:ABC-type quaternary amine transporter n=1 Tax=Desulfuribacillus alkaliarsenatis TaxID=766136 RepID=A0A1E5G487_9FIRM|nr:ABC transporter ATP-binding protein [Desulfuribacillus alkaliarsenatis]OEF97479.1 hypothetical protein BHF68_04545 [Desulfuribacillus alkaliarsenatis]